MIAPLIIHARPEPVTAHEMLIVAYARPCFICDRTGACEHREPRVEMATSGRKLAQVDALRRMEGSR